MTGRGRFPAHALTALATNQHARHPSIPCFTAVALASALAAVLWPSLWRLLLRDMG